MPTDAASEACRCFSFEQDFVGNWRCIPLCLRRKLDLAGIKLKLSHWIALDAGEREQLVHWPDDPAALQAMARHLVERTHDMADGAARSLSVPMEAPWQNIASPPEDVVRSATALGWPLAADQWRDLGELERFALCKLARPGHDHQNLAPALLEFFGPVPRA